MSLFKTFLLACSFLVLSSSLVGAGKSRDVADLGQYLWKNRLLFLFSPSSEFPAFHTLSGEVDRDLEGVRDRDLLVYRILGQGPSFLGSCQITPPEAVALRRRFGVTRGAFTVVLVGKDGTVKLKRQGPTALRDIFGLIDSMPMRQREMQGK